jgi:MFS superfamily sulfate permease-like transporter/CRP-like cAMP-binding protein
MAATRTVITNPFYAEKGEEDGDASGFVSAKADDTTAAAASTAATDESGVLSPGTPGAPDATAWELDEPEKPDEHPVLTLIKDVWTLLTSGKNMVAGLAAATHVNIYLLSLGLILSTPYFNPMATLQVAVVGTIIMQVTAVFLSPYNAFAIANCDSVPAAVMVNIIATVVQKVEFSFEEDQQAAREDWETANNYTHTVLLASTCATPVCTEDRGVQRANCPHDCADDVNIYQTIGGAYDLGTYDNPGSQALDYGGPGSYTFTECWEHGARFQPTVEGEPGVLCSEKAHSTIMMTIIVANMFVALSLYILGSGHAARVIAFVPTTVQAAFLAAVGFKILKMGLFFLVTRAEVKQLMSLGISGGSLGELTGIFLMCFVVMGLATLINYVEIKMHHSKISDWVWPIMFVFLTGMFYVVLGIYAATKGIGLGEALQHANHPGLNKTSMAEPAVYLGDESMKPMIWTQDSSFPQLPKGMGWLMDDEAERYTATCFETATVSKLEHKLACASIIGVALDNEDACMSAATREHDGTPACTYSAAGDVGMFSGYLMNLMPQFAHFAPTTIYWGAIFNTTQLGQFFLLDIITVLAILLNTVAIEEETNRDIDFDRELKCISLGNFIASCFGSFTGYASAAKTLLCHGMGGEHYAGAWCAAYFTVWLFFGRYIAMLVPIPVVGGFISAIGMELLVEWIWHMRHKLTKSEMYELMLLFIFMCFNFILGFLFGMMLSLLAFTARYVQTPVVKTALTGRDYQGKAVRDWKSKTVLMRYGSEILTLRLQGFIFFATAERLRFTVMDMLKRRAKKGRPVAYLILDFHMVDNIDATAVKKIKKVLRFCEEGGVMVIITSLTESMEHAMHHDECTPEHFTNVKVMEDVDIGVEWASDQILASPNHQIQFFYPDKVKGRHTIKTIGQGMLSYIRVGFGKFVHGEAFDSVNFREGGTRMVFNKGDVIATQQDWVTNNEHLYFIAEGSCIKVHDTALGSKRIEKRYRGNVIGEMSFFLKAPRGDNIIADDNGTVVFEYTHKQFDKLKEEFPYIGEHMLKHALQKMSDAVKRVTHENHLLMVMDGYEHEESDDDDFEELNETGDTEGAAKKKEKGRFGKKGAADRLAGRDADKAKQQRIAAGNQDMEADEQVVVHKHSGFGILGDEDDENLSAETLAKTEVLSSE